MIPIKVYILQRYISRYLPSYFAFLRRHELRLELGSPQFRRLKLMTQQFIRVPPDSGLLRRGLEGCDLSSQAIDLFRPAGLMRLLAMLGAFRSVPHRLQLALQRRGAAWVRRRRQSYALLRQEPIDSGHAAAGSETRFQRPPHARAGRQDVFDREFPNHGPNLGVADSR